MPRPVPAALPLTRTTPALARSRTPPAVSWKATPDGVPDVASLPAMPVMVSAGAEDPPPPPDINCELLIKTPMLTLAPLRLMESDAVIVLDPLEMPRLRGSMLQPPIVTREAVSWVDGLVPSGTMRMPAEKRPVALTAPRP